jgi:hypothetical protein
LGTRPHSSGDQPDEVTDETQDRADSNARTGTGAWCCRILRKSRKPQPSPNAGRGLLVRLFVGIQPRRVFAHDRGR